MTTILMSPSAESKLCTLKVAIAELLEDNPDNIPDTSKFSNIFGTSADAIPEIWERIPSLRECRLRVTPDWTPCGLAQEWAKAETSRIHL